MIWDYIKADALFRDYLPEIKSHKNKIRGFNGRGNPTGFTLEEKKAILAAIKKMFKDTEI